MLEHLRVVELGQVIAGTIGGMILGDLGAEVIKVEPLGGDPGRRSAVYGVGDESAIHLTFNRNKKSIAINLKDPRGREALLDLVATADAVIENFRPGVLDRLEIDFDQLRRVKENLVLVSVSGFGSDSPYRDLPAYDLIIQAMSGQLRIMGEPGRPPVIVGVPVADMVSGVYSAIAVLAGFEGSQRSRSAVHFDLSMLDVMVAMLGHVGTLFLNTGQEQEPQGSAHPFLTPWQAFRCADGEYVAVSPREEHFWQRLVDHLDLPDLARPEFDHAVARYEHRDELLPLLEAAFAKKPAQDWIRELRAAEVPAAPVNRMSQIFRDAHVEQRQMVQAFELGDETISVVGNPLATEGTQKPDPAPAPPLGAHTDSVLRDLLGYDEAKAVALKQDGVVA